MGYYNFSKQNQNGDNMKQFGLVWSAQDENFIHSIDDNTLVFNKTLYTKVGSVNDGTGKTLYFDNNGEQIKLLRQKNPYLYKDAGELEYLIFANNVFFAQRPYEDEDALKPYFDKDINKDNSLIIQGDNYQALELLQEGYKESVDLICIDPPYNTGNEDMKYNDLFPVLSNGDRHSSWLSFMNKRLQLAKNLMTKDGLIFINIDEYEFPYLKLLCDDVFGIENFVETFVWEKNSTKNNSRTTSTNHEFILCYAKKKQTILDKKFFRIEKEGVKEINAIRESIINNPEIDDKKTAIEYEIDKFLRENKYLKGIKHYKRVDENLRVYRISDVSAPAGNGLRYDIIHPETGKPCKQPAGGYRYSEETIKEHIANNLFHFGKDEKTVPQFKRYLEDVETEVVKSVIRNTDEGRKDLEKIFGKSPFNNPKPVSLIEYMISMIPKDNMVCMDFFAGSGTTGHAVMEFNKKNMTNHQFILVTNNENNICDSITVPRIEKAKELLDVDCKFDYVKIRSR